MKMNQEVKQSWLKALRGGKYEQGIGRLKCTHSTPEKYFHCCLGVMAETIRDDENIDLCNDKIIGLRMPTPSMNEGVGMAADFNWRVPVEIAMKHAPDGFDGFDSDDYYESGNDGEPPMIGIAILNDTYNFNFEHLANIIEEYY